MSKYEPIIKGKNFCPNPIVKWGIPEFADTVANPKVIGTLAHEDWWNEQFNRCLNGYKTGGIFITGRYYYYLNFCIIYTVKRGPHAPDYVDLDLEFFNTVEQAKKEYKGIITLKARRRGLSFKMGHGIIDYGLRFSPAGYNAGIAAGVETYAVSFFNKLKDAESKKPPELRLHYLNHNMDEIMSGYTEMTSQGQVDKGSKNRVLCKWMAKDPNIFKGEAFDDVVFEEAGEFLKLLLTYGATEDCFKVGHKMVGTPYVQGTGGNIKSSSKDFLEMWTNADHYSLIQFRVPARRLFIGCFCGSRNENGKIEEDIPYIKEKYTPEQRIGMEDTQRAEEIILTKRKELVKGKNKQKYYDYLQNNPLNDEESFLQFSGNNFDTESLAAQKFKLQSATTLNYSKYKLDWIRNENGSVKIPLQVKADPAHDNALDEDCILIRHPPLLSWKNTDIAGIDSYDLDESATSNSLGAMVVLRRKNNPTMPGKRIPVCLVRNRPRRKEIFYEMCMKVAVYYGLFGNCLIDYSKPLIIQHFKVNGAERYLAPRPRSFETEWSQLQHDYGVSINVNTKPRMIALLQTFVLDDIDECYFPHIVDELIKYDVDSKESDWDAADALGIALMRDADMKHAPSEKDAADQSHIMSTPRWEEINGYLVDVNQKNKADLSDVKDPFIRKLLSGEL